MSPNLVREFFFVDNYVLIACFGLTCSILLIKIATAANYYRLTISDCSALSPVTKNTKIFINSTILQSTGHLKYPDNINPNFVRYIREAMHGKKNFLLFWSTLTYQQWHQRLFNVTNGTNQG